MKTPIILAVFLVLTSCADMRINRNVDGLKAVFKVKDATEIKLFASYNGYIEQNGEKEKDTWVFTLPNVSTFRFFLTKDGKTYLPDCPMKEDDGFGGKLCIYQED